MNKLAFVALLLGGAIASAAPKATSASKMPPAHKPKMTLSIDEPIVAGALDPSSVEKIIARKKAALLACFVKHQAKLADVASSATSSITIGSNGAVSSVTTGLLIKPVETCVNAILTKLVFGKPTDGASVEVLVTLSYNTGDTAVYGGLLGTEDGGGTVAIGGGSGTGSGYGIGGRGGTRVRSSALPTIKIGTSTVTGDLDPAIIRRYIKRQLMRLQHCFEKELFATPDLRGTVKVSFTIGGDGRVTLSSASGLSNTNVESCMAGVIKAIEFPKAKGGGNVVVMYPFAVDPGTPRMAPAPTTKPAAPAADKAPAP